jgi:hypothetical protein
MPVVALGSLRSCGVTTAALALANSWPADRRVLLVEVDPAGGTLAATLSLPPEPGLISLAAATRRPLESITEPRLVLGHTQRLGENASVLIAPPSAEQSRQTCALLEPLLARLDTLDVDVLLDCGRLERAAPTTELFAAASIPLLLTRAQLGDLHTAASSLERMVGHERVALVVVGDAAYPEDEVAGALGREVLGSLPLDPIGISKLGGAERLKGRFTRSPLLRSASSLASLLVKRLGESRAVGLDSAVPSWNGHQ